MSCELQASDGAQQSKRSWTVYRDSQHRCLPWSLFRTPPTGSRSVSVDLRYRGYPL